MNYDMNNDRHTAMILDLLVVIPTAYTAYFSCFVTMMLSITRALALAKPLYVINEQLVKRAFLTFTLLLFLLLVVKCLFIYHQYDEFHLHFNRETADKVLAATELSIITTIVVVVILSCVVSVKALKNANSSMNGQKNTNGNGMNAAKMIVALSITFIIFNGTWCFMWVVLWIYITYITKNFAILVIIIFQTLVMVTLNSCANPIVYLVRNSGLHEYAKRNVLNFKRFVVGKF